VLQDVTDVLGHINRDLCYKNWTDSFLTNRFFSYKNWTDSSLQNLNRFFSSINTNARQTKLLLQHVYRHLRAYQPRQRTELLSTLIQDKPNLYYNTLTNVSEEIQLSMISSHNTITQPNSIIKLGRSKHNQQIKSRQPQ